MKLVVVDDHTVVRKGIISMLSLDNSIQEIKEASNIEEAIKVLKNEKPDIALVDLKLQKEDGLDIIKEGKKMSLETKYIILTSFISREDFIRAEKIGVDGYVMKNAYVEDILYALQIVKRGKMYIDSEILDYIDQKDDDDICKTLTGRETDVLNELIKGLSNDEIAKKLYISENTVKKYVSNILSKLNLKSRTQAVAFLSNTKYH